MNIFVHGNYGYGNLADDIILETIIEDVDKKIRANFVVSCTNSKNVVLSKHLYKKLKLIDVNEGLVAIKNINEINNCDFFVLGGAPHLNGPESVIIELSRMFYALFLGKKVFVWGIQFGFRPIKSKIIRLIARLILSKVSLITVRDKVSYRRLIDLDVKCPIIRSTDPVLHWQPQKKDYKNLIKQYNIRMPLISFFPRIDANWPKYFNCINQPYILKNKLDMELNGSKKIANLIDTLIEKTGAHILLIAEEFFENEYISDRHKFDQILSFSKYKDKIIVVNQVLQPAEFKYIINLADLIVSERIHPIVMSRDTFIPAVGINKNQKKVVELMSDIGQKRIIDFGSNQEKNKKILLDTFKERKKIKKELKRDYKRILNLSHKNDEVIEKMTTPSKHRKNYLKKIILYFLSFFIALLIYSVRRKEFIEAKYLKRNKLLKL